MNARVIATQCCIVGGGPAGMMLGYLLARGGVEVVVLEKHADFLRDFRGDTIHPSTLEALNGLGLYDEFLKLPHQEARHLSAQIGDTSITIADFSHMPTRAKFIALMPQWDFLDFLAGHARAFPNFTLIMQGQVDGLLEEGGRVSGVHATTPDGPREIRATLTVGCDGRHSTVRDKAGFVPHDIGAPMDILWFRLSRVQSDPQDALGRIDAGQMLVLIGRGDHWQCGYVVAKGQAEAMRRDDVDTLRARVARLAPFLGARVSEIATWDDAKLLTVGVDRLPLWHKPGVLCIGDAAHTMSPVGGVGINLAVQDAIAAANLLVAPLSAGASVDGVGAALQARREPAVKATQAAQVFIQRNVIAKVLGSGDRKMTPPWFLRLFAYLPWLQRWPARAVGLGVKPEHVTAPEILSAAPPARR